MFWKPEFLVDLIEQEVINNHLFELGWAFSDSMSVYVNYGLLGRELLDVPAASDTDGLRPRAYDDVITFGVRAFF